MRVAAWTHVGQVRSHNEDAVALPGVLLTDAPAQPVDYEAELESGAVFAAIDGMGGHAGGQHASRFVALGLVAGCDDIETTLRSLHSGLFDEMRARPELTAMGATVAGIHIRANTAVIFNVGDARVYRHVDGYSTVLTVDDRSPGSTNVITQSLGGTDRPTEIDVHRVEVMLDTRVRFLACTDGLSEYVPFGEIQAALDQLEPVNAVRSLVASALAAGAPDNVSVLLFDYDPAHTLLGAVLDPGSDAPSDPDGNDTP